MKHRVYEKLHCWENYCVQICQLSKKTACLGLRIFMTRGIHMDIN